MEIVIRYSHLNSERGYKAALQEFRDRYGDAVVIAQHYVKETLIGLSSRQNTQSRQLRSQRRKKATDPIYGRDVMSQTNKDCTRESA